MRPSCPTQPCTPWPRCCGPAGSSGRTGSRASTDRPAATLNARCVMADVCEEVQLQGHIIDSLLLPKVLDVILTHGGTYVIKDIKIGQRGSDPSQAKIEVRAATTDRLHEILDVIHDHGAVPVHVADCATTPADMDGAFPEGFYCTTNFRTQVRVGGQWLDVLDQEMDCGVVIDVTARLARCVPMTRVRTGDQV